MIRLKLVLLVFFCCPLLMQAQDLTGTWIGYNEKLYVKLVIIHKGDSVIGYTYDKKPGFCQATFLGIYDKKERYLKGSNMEMLLNSGNHVLSSYELKYIKEFGKEKLHGITNVKSFGRPSAVERFLATDIFLRKENNAVDTIPFMRAFIEKP